MADRIEVTRSEVVTVEVTPEMVARLFCSMDDEEQADFFEHVGKIADGWTGGAGQHYQWHLVGNHMRDCSCVTRHGRAVVASIMGGMEHA